MTQSSEPNLRMTQDFEYNRAATQSLVKRWIGRKGHTSPLRSRRGLSHIVSHSRNDSTASSKTGHFLGSGGTHQTSTIEGRTWPSIASRPGRNRHLDRCIVHCPMSRTWMELPYSSKRPRRSCSICEILPSMVCIDPYRAVRHPTVSS